MNLGRGSSIKGFAETNSAIAYNINGLIMAVNPKSLTVKGYLEDSLQTLYVASDAACKIETISLANRTDLPVKIMNLLIQGISIIGQLIIPPSGTANYSNGMWQVLNSAGNIPDDNSLIDPSRIVQDSTHRFVTDTQIESWDETYEPSHYSFDQNTPQINWYVNHNLGYFPNVRVQNSAGDYIVTDIQDIDENNLIIKFTSANAGKAYCS